jgi:hypothetical protein
MADMTRISFSKRAVDWSQKTVLQSPVVATAMVSPDCQST